MALGVIGVAEVVVWREGAAWIQMPSSRGGVEEVGVFGGKGGDDGSLQAKALSRYGRVDGGAARVWRGIVGLEVLGYVADHKVVGARVHGLL